MNYVADVAILDRGDAPAQAVLDRTARSLAQRVADETRDELQKVMSRVDRIYGTYEKPPEIDLDDNNLHYANDLKELEELLQDAVKKKKYQHKVTIFIVGYENVCGQKLRLLQQVNEFFMDNANKFEEEETEIRKPDFDMDEAKEVVEDTLATTESLAKRLGDINKEMAEYMYEWSRQQATTNKKQSKKKLERSLAQARDEITGLGEKLSHLSEELEEKEDRIQQMFKQIELKNMEAQRYKTAAEVAKRSAEESDSLRDALAQRDEELMALRKDNEKLRGDMQNLESNGYSTQMQIANMEEENAARIDRLKQAMDELRDQEVEESNKELQRIHESQIEEINKSHKAEVEELKTQHEAEIKKLLDEIERLKVLLEKSGNSTEIEEVAAMLLKSRANENLHKERSFIGTSGKVSNLERERSGVSLPPITRQPSFTIVPAPQSNTPRSRMSTRHGQRQSRERDGLGTREGTRLSIDHFEVNKPSTASKLMANHENQQLSNDSSPRIERFPSELIKAQKYSPPADGSESRGASRRISREVSFAREPSYAIIENIKESDDHILIQKSEQGINEKMEGIELDKNSEQPKEDQQSDQMNKELDRPVLTKHFEQGISVKGVTEDNSKKPISDIASKESCRDLNISRASGTATFPPIREISIKDFGNTPSLPQDASHYNLIPRPESDVKSLIMSTIETLKENTEMTERQYFEEERSISEMALLNPEVTLLCQEPSNISKAVSDLDISSIARHHMIPHAPPPSRENTTVDYHQQNTRMETVEEKEEQERSRASQKEKLGKKFSKSKDVAEVAVQDNNGDPNTATVDQQSQPAKRGKNLEPVFEEIEFDDVFDLQDEESWSSVPPAHILSRFKQYRSLTSEKLQNYDDQLDSTIKKTQRKIETLKAQFHEHKKKWEHERQQILQEIEAKENLQRDAERQADRAIAHLEEFITEQEILEQEEEKARQALESGAKEPIVSLAEAEQQLAQTIERHSAEEQQINDMLLAQTDDAKAEMSRKNTQFEDKSDLKIDGNTHDEILRNSAMSRASLRSQHKEALQVLKSSAEERRTKSPGMQSVRSQKSVLSELELDEDGDMPFPPDESKEEKAQRERKLSMHDIATSPMAKFYRKQIPMYDHPVVQEFLKAYDVTTTFKDNLGSMFTDKEILIAGQLLSEIETVRFDKDDKVQPQLEQMTNSIMSILEETYQIIASVLSNERDYPVSSLYNLSRDPTRSVITRPNTETRSASGAGGGNAAMDAELKELHQQYLQLQKKFDEEAKKHTEQLHHNTVIMMEMQDTINTLQRELNTVSSKATVIPESAKDTPIMFTRLDSERNAKMLKRGVNENRVDVENYQQAVETMDAYVNIPRKRLASLAQKYSHHVQMKEIEENVRNSRSLDDKVFDILDKMEALQNERAKRWAEKMDEYAAERTKLANMLMVTLDELERQSGIFLIKPMFSYRSKPEITQYHNKMSRPYKPARSPFRHAGSAVAPVPTPASMRPYSQATVKNDNYNQNGGLMGQQTLLIGDYGARPVWNPNEANGKTLSDDQLMFLHQSQLGTPKILELDINRMLIGQNQISMNIPPNVPMSNDRLVNAANTTTRAYVTVNRPTGNGQKKDEKRPRSHKEKSDVPPTTPMRSSTAGSGKNVKDDKAGRNLPATPPLPPITPRSENEAPYPPASPPGSSLRQTPADNLVSQ